MLLLYVGLTLGTVGKLIIGIAVIRVHSRIAEEHKIDAVVLRAIAREKYITALGVVCIIVGYILEMMFYASTELMLS